MIEWKKKLLIIESTTWSSFFFFFLSSWSHKRNLSFKLVQSIFLLVCRNTTVKSTITIILKLKLTHIRRDDHFVPFSNIECWLQYKICIYLQCSFSKSINGPYGEFKEHNKNIHTIYTVYKLFCSFCKTKQKLKWAIF